MMQLYYDARIHEHQVSELVLNSNKPQSLRYSI